MKKTQKGFAVLEGLLILVIITIIGSTGYYVWNSKSKTNESLNNASTISQNNVSKGNKKNLPTFSGTAANGYLNIKQWGVRLKVTPQISDIYYILSGDNASLGLKSLDNLMTQDGTKCRPDENSVVGIGRFTRPDYQTFLQSTGYDDTAIHIGNNYYYAGVADPPVPPCRYTSNGLEGNDIYSKIQAEITATNSLEAIPH